MANLPGAVPGFLFRVWGLGSLLVEPGSLLRRPSSRSVYVGGKKVQSLPSLRV